MSQSKDGLLTDEKGVCTCWWHGGDPEYRRYHDEEWGRPVSDDVRLFEKICLEGFQAGLSWLTILRKRENFRAAFHGFEPAKVACMDERDVEELLQNKGIVRHKGKINSTINNAQQALKLQEEFGSLAAYFWQWEPAANTRPAKATYENIAKIAQTEVSKQLSKDLKKRGWSFVGPTTVYAFMQAMGLVNDHLEGCSIRSVALEARRDFIKPTKRDKHK
ncbi:DNA-3-methyladenine glycosylase I [Polycladidibacter hongkongensis]|uniref:DNA-3-methyladenine glycosylase I n=1 Tax=Polycladidibacter hongkongensis TaxID=1647556 RepID=UPI00082FB97F|nr:DNA-3-methyladenine glycosylase I [Pseudovibrio hongkongensis]